MGRFKYLFIIPFCFLGACNDGNPEEKYILSPEFLQQTTWEGRCRFAEQNYSVAIQFVNDKRGRVEISDMEKDMPFTYHIENNKLLRFNVQGTLMLDRDWILFEIRKDYLYFRSDYTGTDDGKFLELYKTTG